MVSPTNVVTKRWIDIPIGLYESLQDIVREDFMEENGCDDCEFCPDSKWCDIELNKRTKALATLVEAHYDEFSKLCKLEEGKNSG